MKECKHFSCALCELKFEEQRTNPPLHYPGFGCISNELCGRMCCKHYEEETLERTVERLESEIYYIKHMISKLESLRREFESHDHTYDVFFGKSITDSRLRTERNKTFGVSISKKTR